MDQEKTWADLIREAITREQNPLTIEEIASGVGVSTQAVNAWLRGAEPYARRYQRLKEVLGLDGTPLPRPGLRDLPKELRSLATQLAALRSHAEAQDAALVELIARTAQLDRALVETQGALNRLLDREDEQEQQS